MELCLFVIQNVYVCKFETNIFLIMFNNDTKNIFTIISSLLVVLLTILIKLLVLSLYLYCLEKMVTVSFSEDASGLFSLNTIVFLSY